MNTFSIEKETVEMREVYSKKLVELAQKDKTVVALEADLSSSISTNKIKEQLGERLINVGIMEAEMIGCAAGLAVVGFKPFIHTFANFATRRVYDQIFVSLAYSQLNAVILGSDAGVTAEHNGGTHMPFEDLALMRIIPHVTVYEASDSTMLEALLQKGYENKGITYIRTIRKQAKKIYNTTDSFDSGAFVVREGEDVSIIASGIMVSEALTAAHALAEEGIEATVIDLYRIKPINRNIIKFAAEKGSIVTVENHNIIGGLGSAVAEVLAEEKPTQLYRLGVNEKFGQVGETEWLKKDYGISAKDIVRRVKKAVLEKEDQHSKV